MPDSPPREHSLLSRVQTPEALRSLDAAELPALCEELRAFLLDSVQRTGGHLGSNLGVVELTVALHRVFDFRRDRLVFDVSHQSYVHKILTGRLPGFAELRRTGGLCGFTDPSESDYDLFHLGHAGTSIGLGLGLAKAAAHEPDPPHVVSVIGDASLGAGVAFEALNHAGASGESMLVILNDNEWSISKSVGALARYLTRIRSARVLQRAQQEIHGLLQSIPLIGKKVEDVIEQLREVLRHAIVQGHVFEEFGVTYIGPVDGHDVDYLVESLERVRKLEGVVLLHTLTQKGKGHPDAATHPERMHAAKPAPRPPAQGADREAGALGKLETVPAQPAPAPRSYTQAFADGLRKLAERDLRVHAITAGMPSGTGLVGFGERFPSRFHDVGICEQHAVAMAAGMAKAGLRPVVAIYSTFLQRAYDQVFQEVALQNLPVTFALDRAGLVGQDGPTHNGLFDLAFLRVLPHMTVAAPRDATDLERLLDLGVRRDTGPVALRFPRDSVPGTERLPAEERAPMEPGRAEVLLEGQELLLWASGALVSQGLEAVEALRARGVAAGLVDARFVKPLDEELLAAQLRTCRHIVTLEEHQRAGGLGSAVLEAASRLPVSGSTGERGARIRTLGVPDRFVAHASSRDEQLASLGLDAAGVERSLTGILRASLV